MLLKLRSKLYESIKLSSRKDEDNKQKNTLQKLKKYPKKSVEFDKETITVYF
jgi:hypothetical protein